MLIHLHVKNLALIEETEVEFGPGLNILTGETGAGKSILLGSISLILGTKSSRGMIRENAPYALVELLFQVENTKAREALAALDIYPEEGQILLSRKILDGRSVNKINGETVTVSQMKAAASCLLDIHGQHEHQSLLYGDRQLDILDAYGRERIASYRADVEAAYRDYRKALSELKALDVDEEQRNREMSFLEFEIREIQDAALCPGEDEDLERQYRKLMNGKKIMEALQSVHSAAGYDQGAGDLVGEAQRELSRVTEFDEELEALEESLDQVDSLLNDFNRELSSYMDRQSFDEETFYNTERRLDQVNSLKAKYGHTVEDILAYQEKQQKKLEELEEFDENLRRAKEQKERAEKKLRQASYELSGIRKEYGKQLEKEITEGLREMNFEQVKFAIVFRQSRTLTEKGCDEVEYEISTNPGEKLKPLGQIASGGELSRIMLAIKAILADRDEIDTLIFDEIDTGISGRTAQKVSEKMAVIGKHRQVLCITHLPQIAAMADTHFEIEKHVDHGQTVTQIHPLSEEASVRELARLLGGAQITDAVLQNAREMKELARVHKNTRLK
ncbi:MAG: DNA repair protein RecN [Clostridiales bacterium]|nr:DNA repair protein RecN [Clostridiales bacterium]